jgi:hypothetical protein
MSDQLRNASRCMDAAIVSSSQHLGLLLGLLLLRTLALTALRLDVFIINSHGLIDLGAKSGVILDPVFVSVLNFSKANMG